MMEDTTTPEHHFELTVSGPLTDERLDALFEAGCDDATLSSKGELIFAAFDRQAPTLPDAVISAIRAIETVSGLEVLHVDPDDLVWASEIAERTSRTRQSVGQLIKGMRGPGGFPSPTSHATRNPLWCWAEVEAWFAAYEGHPSEADRCAVIGAINGALKARHNLRAAVEAAPLRRVVEELLVS